MNSAYYHDRLSDNTTWDDLKTIYGLRQPAIDTLKVSDPTPEDPPDGETQPAWRVWTDHGITLHDARMLWPHLNKDTTDEQSAASDEGDPQLDNSAPARRQRASTAAN